MKKILVGFLLAALLATTGCGVKSSLSRPDDTFPRDYPIY